MVGHVFSFIFGHKHCPCALPHLSRSLPHVPHERGTRVALIWGPLTSGRHIDDVVVALPSVPSQPASSWSHRCSPSGPRQPLVSPTKPSSSSVKPSHGWSLLPHLLVLDPPFLIGEQHRMVWCWPWSILHSSPAFYFPRFCISVGQISLASQGTMLT